MLLHRFAREHLMKSEQNIHVRGQVLVTLTFQHGSRTRRRVKETEVESDTGGYIWVKHGMAWHSTWYDMVW